MQLTPVQNRLLASMSAETFSYLRPHLQRVALKSGEILQERNRPLQHVHFIERGIASLFARTSQTVLSKWRIIGRLGLVGIPVVLGTMRWPNRCRMQVPGEALRIASPDLSMRSSNVRSCAVVELCSGPSRPKLAIRVVQCPPRAAPATSDGCC